MLEKLIYLIVPRRPLENFKIKDMILIYGMKVSKSNLNFLAIFKGTVILKTSPQINFWFWRALYFKNRSNFKISTN